MRPVWNWLNRNSEIGGGFQGLPFAMPQISGQQLINSMKQFNASVPWRSVTASMVLLDSHDTARFRTVVKGDVPSHLSAMSMVLTYPGVPSIFAGDEIGLEGSWGEDGRRTINWDDRSQWDHAFMAQVQQLISIRKSNDALIDGGLRWLAAEKDFILYLRESKKQSILVFVSRKGVNAKIDLSTLGLKVSKTLYGPTVTGSNFGVKSKVATQGIWVVTK
jgi:alpha-glucosidase